MAVDDTGVVSLPPHRLQVRRFVCVFLSCSLFGKGLERVGGGTGLRRNALYFGGSL